MVAWTWAAARCRGTSHVQAGTRCQDAFSCIAHQSGQLISVLCDGAGSAELGGEGASIVARLVSMRARAYYNHSSDMPSDETIAGWIDDARDGIAHAAQVRGKRPRDFAATLLCVVSDGTRTLVIHVGDGCAVGKSSRSNEWLALTWPAHGEYASTTYFVTDDPQPQIAIHRHDEPLSAIVAFTDGLERLALDFTEIKPHARFFEGIAAPVFTSTAKRRDGELSAQLARYLDSAAVNARTDDDKTLLIAVRR